MWFYFVTGLGSQGQLYDVSALLSDKGKSDSLELAIFSAPDGGGRDDLDYEKLSSQWIIPNEPCVNSER